MTPTVIAKTEKGKCIPEDPEFLREIVRAFEGKRYRIKFEAIRKNRPSPEQYGYYFAVFVPMIAKEMGMRKWEYDKVHAYLRNKFHYQLWVGKNGQEEKLPVSTTEMEPMEFSQEYLDAIREWAFDFFGIQIPEPHKVGH